MRLAILGDPPQARDGQGNLKSRIGTIFLCGRVLVTLPGVHATQRLAYSEHVNQQRRAQGLAPLSADEELAEWEQSVDLVMTDSAVLIRPDPENMPLAFAADELLQELVSKQHIKFLNVMDDRVRQAVKERGECWRISSLPQSAEEMKRMIQAARIGIGERALYYYSMVTGTRYLTYDEFSRLASLEPGALARQLQEIRNSSGQRNRLQQPEVDFFGADSSFGRQAFAVHDFLQAEPAQVRAWYAELRDRFRQAVKPELRTDDLENLEWRNRLFSALIGQRDETVAEEILRGLSLEFFMQIQWLPGGRISDGEFVFDPIFDGLEQRPADPELAALCDAKAKGLIFNFIREFDDVEYVNVGRVAGSLSRRAKGEGRRGVYLAEIKQRDRREPVARVIRLQKWDIADHLDAGKNLLEAILEAEEYTEYVLDRRLGCRQLGMNLPPVVSAQRIHDSYAGARREYAGQMIWFTYFERDYIPGVATDKIASSRYQVEGFALRLARLLGEAAAPSLVVGKVDRHDQPLFDDGDEILLTDEQGQPREIMAADYTGAFLNYTAPLSDFAAVYAQPVNRRLGLVPDPAAFAAAYHEAFVAKFLVIQQRYRNLRRGFDTLFKHRQHDEGGSFAYRWEKVLERLDHTDAAALGAAIRSCFKVP